MSEGLVLLTSPLDQIENLVRRLWTPKATQTYFDPDPLGGASIMCRKG